MADNDKELKIHIATTADTAKVQEFNNELGRVKAKAEDESEAALKSAASATESSGAHWELRRAFESLSQIMPGLGPLAGLVGEGFRDMAAGEAEATVAMDTLITTMGPVAIVILSIQAALTYWDMFKEKSKEAAEEFTKASKEIEDASQKALDAYNQLQDALSGKDKSVTKQYQEELKNRQSIAEANSKSYEEVVGAQKQAELDRAGDNAAAKFEIEKKYAGILRQHQLDETAQKTRDEQAVINEAEIDLQKRLKKIEDEKAKLATLPASDYWGRTGMMNQIGSDSKAAETLTEFINNLKGQTATEKTATGIETAGFDRAKDIGRQSDFDTGVRAMMGDYGKKLSGQQQAAEQMVAQIFEDHGGRLDVWLKHLQGFRNNYESRNRAIEREFELLSRHVGTVANNGTQ
ncbi:MAG TPA: hypothetical protein VMH87_07820 [Pseudomonadales bacterium]|nr:hypothetical protein [Pseudomonadales bacterium]